MAESEEYKRIREELELQLSIKEKVRAEGVTMLQLTKDIYKYQKLIVDQEKKRKQLLDQETKLTKELAAAEKAYNAATGKAKDDAEAVWLALGLQHEELQAQIAIQDNLLKKHKLVAKTLKQQTVSIGTITKLTGRTLLKGAKTLLTYYIEQDKELRSATKSMGLLSKQSNAFATNVFKAAENTNMLGIQAKDLAKIQAAYSEGLGRNVMLSQQGLEAMAQMAAGTSLGNEGAAEMAVNMEQFGLSAEMSRDAVETMLNSANKLGVNADKSIANLQKNLKIAQKYNFKDGVKGMKEMALFASKFKVDMNEISGLADKIMDIEGAVEMAGSLQTLGGEWAKLGDPFKLMYQARNDVKGLAEDFAKAAASTGHFNKETGELEISSLELSRLKEVSKLTGLSIESLTNQARDLAKFKEIRMEIKSGTDPKLQKFLESSAFYDDKQKGFVIDVGTSTPKLIKSLDPKNIQYLNDVMNSESTLKKRAENAQSFDQIITNLTNTFKTFLLPFVRGVDDAIRKPLTDLMASKSFEKFKDGMKLFGEYTGKFLVGLVEFVSENPIKSALILGTAGLAKAAFDLGKWTLNGVMLGKGFNMTANVGGGGGGGIMDFFSKGGRKGFANAGKGGKGLLGKIGGKLGNLTTLGKIGTGVASMGAGLAGDYTGSFLSEKSGLEDSAGGDMGSMIGGLIGGALGTLIPIPGVGTAIGAYAGSTLGKWGGDFVSSKMDDFVMRPGAGAVPFSKDDTLVGAKPGGPIDKMLNNEGGTSKASGGIDVSFSRPLEVKGEINIVSNGQSTPFKLDDPIFIRELTRMINEQLRKSASGILSPSARS